VHRRRGILVVGFVLAAAVRAAGQDDVLARAREAATSGRSPEALSILEERLADTPRDVDARLLYGLVLSWEGRYDEARPALQQVLAQTPDYTDARVALMNVEYWSGNSVQALEQAETILAKQPGNVTARAVRERLEAAARPWWVTARYSLDTFNDGTEPWHETNLYVTRRTPVGALIVRGNHAARFGNDDQMVEVEFYPRFRPGTYAYLSVGVAPDASLYPSSRFAFDLYQSIGRGLEVSGGARYLDFGTVTKMYVGTLAKYVGTWMFAGKVYHVPGEGPLNSTSYHGGFRRYYGGDGTSYAGITYSHGFSREEIRSLADLATLDSDGVYADVDHLFGSRLRVFATGGTGRQERANRPAVWQTTIVSGVSVQF
jgi:YaiO family outer membrane protein